MNFYRIPTVMLVDDNPNNLKVLAEIVESIGCDTVFSMSGEQTFEYLTVDRPDLILLDVMMPEMDGYEICKRLKEEYDWKDIPVIFITAKSEIADIARGFEVGGVDYITKPFNAVELKMRVKTHLGLKLAQDELERYSLDLSEALIQIRTNNEELLRMNAELESASRTDMLTKLPNRRHILERIEEEIIRFKRSKKTFSFLMIDIDYFKKVNDTYGHEGGDFVLVSLAQKMRETLREQDFIARWGGEEFLCLLPETDVEGAFMLAERFRILIEKAVFVYNEQEIKFTVTIGIGSYDSEDGINGSIKNADDALYKGKQNGRNRTEIMV